MAELIPPSARSQSSVHALTGSNTDRFFTLHVQAIMDDAWGIKDNSLQYGVFLTQFLIQRGVVIGEGRLVRSRVGMIVKTALQPLQEQVDKLSKDVQELRDDQEKLRTAFEGECTVAYLHNKAVMALDDFKTEADPQKDSRRYS
ncbi:hypothetical protein CJ030_MR4G006855 [Morella rubra]|uniref:Uncharacterized protein n=1 Tax=Morella rubra TaxID=262757 RepID=A0A6A1VTR2_9ROSI|nr:hypothetical protein CJ030_MR4G006855 [Morella rubra]